MLSRVADGLFWMSRYLERADHVARLLNTTFHLELDLAGLAPPTYPPPWRTNLTVLQQHPPDDILAGPDPSRAVAAWLAFDLGNPGSILSCVNRARNNARSVRGATGPGPWRALNQLYWQLRDPDFEARGRESPFEYYQAVEAGSQLFQGVCDATLPHDEGWRFIQLGRYLERADKTIRVLDAEVRQWQSLTDPADQTLASLEWAGALKCCHAFEAYQRLYISRVEPDKVVEFLLLNPHSPRSVRFCLEEAAKAIAAIEEFTGRRGGGKADRVVGRMISDLRYAEPGDLLRGDFHEATARLLGQCHQLGRMVQEQYSLVH